MRRALPSLLLLLVLASCRKTPVLPSGEVLHRAAVASQSLASAAYTVDGTLSFKNEEQEGQFHPILKGVLQDGGKQTQLQLRLTGTLTEGTVTYAISGKSDIVVASEEDAYLRLASLVVTPPYPLLNPDALASFLGTWWKLPVHKSENNHVSLGPDPRLLRAQAKVLRVTSERGIEKIHGTEAYHYGITLDREKLLAFLTEVANQKGEPPEHEQVRSQIEAYDVTGEVWIDVATFFLHRILWRITPRGAQDRSFTAAFTLDLTDHNAAPPVKPPTDARPFVPGAFLQPSFIPRTDG